MNQLPHCDAPESELKTKLVVEQYKQLHDDILDSSRIRWQIIGLGGPFVITLLLAAHTMSSSISLTSSLLAAFAVPTSLVLYIAYRKEVYFENLYNETLEEIEKRYGIPYVQRDTEPQKAAELHYLVRFPKSLSPEAFSSYTIQLVLLLIFHGIAIVSFVKLFGEYLSVQHSHSFIIATGTAALIDFMLLFISVVNNRSNRDGWWSKRSA